LNFEELSEKNKTKTRAAGCFNLAVEKINKRFKIKVPVITKTEK